MGAALLVFMMTPAPSRATGILTGITICIDPGHGGSDPGAVNSAYNLQESEINLDVSYGLKTLLEIDDASVFLTRTDDSFKDNEDRYTFCNAVHADILVSIHTNSVEDPSWDGSMALYFHPHEDDRVLAGAVYEIMYPYLQETAPDPENFRSFGLDWFASGVLLRSDMPAAMMEPLFMSNPSEAELLSDHIFDDFISGTINQACEAYSCRRGQVALSIHQGILNYFENSPDPEGSMHVEAIDMGYEKKGSNFFVSTQVSIHDSTGEPVIGAAISLQISQPDGSQVYLTSTTGSDGTALVRIRSNQLGDYIASVTSVVKDGWSYDEAANIETSETLTVP
jgi:N-acetylmuramoyl-L-alanine amidase